MGCSIVSYFVEIPGYLSAGTLIIILYIPKLIWYHTYNVLISYDRIRRDKIFPIKRKNRLSSYEVKVPKKFFVFHGKMRHHFRHDCRKWNPAIKAARRILVSWANNKRQSFSRSPLAYNPRGCQAFKQTCARERKRIFRWRRSFWLGHDIQRWKSFSAV